jgi:N-carbamoylputrescine amidase
MRLDTVRGVAEQFTAACVQMDPRVGDKRHNIGRTIDLMDEAAARGARLVVLPELCTTGYVFESRAEVLGLAETLSASPTRATWEEICRRRDIYVVAGIAERDGDHLYNSALVIGPAGHVGTFRKVHLWDRENLYFTPGGQGFSVFETAIGRLGVAICYDGWFPESYRVCALQGADIVCIPTNWIPEPNQEGQPAMGAILCMANAHVNGVYVMAADRVGSERGQNFVGQSVITSYTGWPIAGPASGEREEIIYAEVDLAQSRRHDWGRFNHPLRDRRDAYYGADLGARGAPSRMAAHGEVGKE